MGSGHKSQLNGIQIMSQPTTNLKQSMIRNGLILAVFSLVSTALVVFTNEVTAGKIESEKTRALNLILHQIVEPSLHDNNLDQDCIWMTHERLLGTLKPVKIFRARKDNRPVALLIQSIAPDGYNGNIELVVGVGEQQQILGIHVLAHNETPGLGDQVEHRKTHWLDIFNDRSLKNTAVKNWKVKKDGGVFDAMTGATITPRAVIQAVLNTLQYVKLHHDELYQQPSSCSGDSK